MERNELKISGNGGEELTITAGTHFLELSVGDYHEYASNDLTRDEALQLIDFLIRNLPMTIPGGE